MNGGPPPTSASTGGELRELLAVLRRRRWSILLITALTVASAFFFSLRQDPLYESSATVAVNPFDPNQVLLGMGSTYLTSMQTELARAESPIIEQLAAEKVEAQTGAAEQTGELDVTIPAETTTLVFAYTDPDPQCGPAVGVRLRGGVHPGPCGTRRRVLRGDGVRAEGPDREGVLGPAREASSAAGCLRDRTPGTGG